MSLTKVLTHAGYGALNAAAAFTFASLSLTHFNKQICVDVHNLRGFSTSNTFSICIPGDSAKQFTQPRFKTWSDYFNNNQYSDPFLDFAAITAGILSLYCAKQAFAHFKAVFKN